MLWGWEYTFAGVTIRGFTSDKPAEAVVLRFISVYLRIHVFT